jgi:hypothetical protein
VLLDRIVRSDDFGRVKLGGKNRSASMSETRNTTACVLKLTPSLPRTRHIPLSLSLLSSWMWY